MIIYGNPTFKTYTWKMIPPKNTSQRDLYQKTYSAIANWKQCLMGTNGLTMTNPWAQLRGGKQKTQFFNERGLLLYLQSCSMKGRLLIKHTARGLTVILTRGQGRWWVPSLALPLPHRSHQYSQERSLGTEQPDFCGWHTENTSLITWLWCTEGLVFTGSVGQYQTNST